MSRVKSLTGRADDFELVFERISDEDWNTIVPPDLQDGYYIVQLWAEAYNGMKATWVGILYMADSRLVYITVLKDTENILMDDDSAIVLISEERVFCLEKCISRDFYLGEKKYIDIQVASRRKQTVVVSSAKYTLMDADDNVVESGDCTVEEGIISVLVEPKETGTYTLWIEYEVAPEVRKAKVTILVH